MTGDSRLFDPRFFELSTTHDCSFSPATYSGTVHNNNKHPLSRRTPTLQEQQTNLFERCYNVRHLCPTIPRNHTTRLAAVGHQFSSLPAERISGNTSIVHDRHHQPNERRTRDPPIFATQRSSAKANEAHHSNTLFQTPAKQPPNGTHHAAIPLSSTHIINTTTMKTTPQISIACISHDLA